MGVRVPPSAHFKYKKLKINKKKISNTESSIDIIVENKDYINPFESKLKELKKLIKNINDIELEIKKNYNNSLYIISNFILEKSSSAINN